jgi:hypothetical protein
LGAAFIADKITWWENTKGDGSEWIAHTVDGNFDGAFSVFATDVDGDGDMDVLGAAFAADDITWWENTMGDGSTWTAHTVDGNFDAAHSVFAADVDGDGDNDILGAAINANKVIWWENQPSSVGSDGVPNTTDHFPLEPSDSVDIDNDGMGTKM